MTSFSSHSHARSRSLLASIDIGTTKVCCLIASYDPSSKSFSVLGVGQYASRGIKDGCITDLESVENAIVNSVYLAEKMAGVRIEKAFINISGSHVLSEHVCYSSRFGSPRVVQEKDVYHLMDQATQVHPSHDFDVIHAFPLSYSLDDQEGIKDPLGLQGSKLTASLNVITASKSPLQNLVHCVQQCHLTIEGIVSSPIAAGYATLVEDEMDLGVTVVDMGGGTTEMAVFFEGKVIHTDSIPLGGRHLTNDLAYGLEITFPQAERVKTLHGSVGEGMDEGTVSLAFLEAGSDKKTQHGEVKKRLLSSFLRPRVEEIFEIIKSRLEKNEVPKVAARRIVLTGGTSQLMGIRERGAQVLERPVRLGKPLKIYGENDLINTPNFSTVAGLIYFGLGERQLAETGYSPQSPNWAHSMLEWIKESF